MGMNIYFFEDALNFVSMHIGREDYLGGQMGYDAMKYDFDLDMNY